MLEQLKARAYDLFIQMKITESELRKTEEEIIKLNKQFQEEKNTKKK